MATYTIDPGYLPCAKLLAPRLRAPVLGDSLVPDEEASTPLEPTPSGSIGRLTPTTDSTMMVAGMLDPYHPLLGSLNSHTMVYCEACEHWAPQDTTHCEMCKSCVLDWDHHCGVFGCCVGIRNIPFFLLTELCAVLTVWLVVLGVIIPSFQQNHTQQRGFWNFHTLPHLPLAIFGFILGIFLTGMTLFHWFIQFRTERHRSRKATSWASAVWLAHKAWWWSGKPESLLGVFLKKKQELPSSL